MKKTDVIKILSRLFLIIIMTFAFTACSDDDDKDKDKDKDLPDIETPTHDETNPIVGTWRYKDSDYEEYITFKGNGTGTLKCRDYYIGEWHEWETAYFTWKTKNGVITIRITWDDDDDTETASGKYKISGNKLSVQDEDGDWTVYTLQ